MWSRGKTQAGWEEYRVTLRGAQLDYEDAEQAFTVITSDKCTNSRKWWSPVKTVVFGASSILPPLVDRGGKLFWSADEKAL